MTPHRDFCVGNIDQGLLVFPLFPPLSLTIVNLSLAHGDRSFALIVRNPVA